MTWRRFADEMPPEPTEGLSRHKLALGSDDSPVWTAYVGFDQESARPEALQWVILGWDECSTTPTAFSFDGMMVEWTHWLLIEPPAGAAA